MCKHHAVLYREPERLQILVSKGGPWKQFPGWQGTTGHCLSPISSLFLLVIYNGMSVFLLLLFPLFPGHCCHRLYRPCPQFLVTFEQASPFAFTVLCR